MKLLFNKFAGLVVFMCIFAFSTDSFAQRTITGVVTDELGDGVIGANVLAVGTSTGTVTDFDGSYSLELPEGATQIEFSYIGYTTQTLDVGASDVLDIQMQEGALLDEVVVVGYGSVKAKEITSSVTSVSAKDFNQGNVNDATQALQGKVPGLSIYNKGGDPNSSSTIRLRGISSVGANASPLIVIDGVIGGSLDNVDPNDIESLNVLKDGSAAAIYGSRGSAGVILVTTKSGKRGEKVTANYNGYVASATVANKIPVFSSSEYLAAGGNDLGSSTVWQDEVTRNAISNVHNLSIAGGSENTTFRLSTNFRDIEGILKKSEFNQINARANVNHYALNDKLNVNFNMALTNRKSNFSYNEALRYAALYNPTAPIRFDNGEYFQAILFDNFNPVAIIEQNQNLGKSRTLNFNVQGSYEIVEGLKLHGNYSEQYITNINGEYNPSTSLFRGLNRNGLAKRSTEDTRSRLFESYLAFNKKLSSKVNLSVTGGYSYQEEQREKFEIEVGNFPSDALGFNILEAGGDLVNGTASGLNVASEITPEEKIIAFFGKFTLSFDDAITLNGSLRREGSTKLGADNQWGLFPAIGAAVDLNKYLAIPNVDNLKLRAGFGVTGALPGESGLSRDKYEYSFDNGGTTSFVRAGNTGLKWEEKSEFNLGLDFGLLDYKLTGSADFYVRNINDFILEKNVEISEFGTDKRFDNSGKLSTTGFELTLTYNGIQKGDFSYTPNIVLSTYKTNLEEFDLDGRTVRGNLGAPGQNGTNVVSVKVGEEIGKIWGPVFTGVDSEGNPIFADLNGDGNVVADAGNATSDDADFQELGSGLPSLELGFSNSFSYKNWDASIFFRGAFGHSLVNAYRAFYEPLDPGAINSYNRVSTDLSRSDLATAQFSSLYVEKADFLRLDNMTVGYKFNLPETSTFRSIRVYASAQNVFTITGYQGIDPDPVLQDLGPTDNGGVLGTVPDVLAPGIDRRNNYFSARTFTFGVNVGF